MENLNILKSVISLTQRFSVISY